MTWLTGWSYRKSHVINYAAGAGTLYQKQITVHYGSGTDGDDDVYLNSHSRTDFGDVRFTDNDETTLLDCWMESKVDGDNAVFWVEVADDLSTVAATIYVYYGKADATYPYLATVEAHGDATFILFENFNTLTDGDLNGQHGWTASTSVDVQTSVVKEGAKALQITTQNHDAYHNITVVSYKMFLQVYLRTDLVSAGGPIQMYIYEGTTQITALDLSNSYKRHLIAPPAWQNIEAASSNVWYKSKVALDSASTHKVWFNDVLKSPPSNANIHNVVSAPTKVRLSKEDSDGATAYFDLVVVGKYVYPEPSHGAWGIEETSGGGTAYTKTVSEILGLLDARSSKASFHKTTSEVLGLVDGKSTKTAFYRTKSEILGLLDVKAYQHGHYKTVSEILGLADAKGTKASFHKAASEILGLLDAKVYVHGRYKTVSEVLGLVDDWDKNRCKKCKPSSVTLTF
jgi:hypothetical protein